jgi:hypothetical protein
MPYSRAHIRLNTTLEVSEFIAKINTDGTTDKYIIEDFNSDRRANARSLIGVMYAMSDFNDEMYLVNVTRTGVFPAFIDAYRA